MVFIFSLIFLCILIYSRINGILFHTCYKRRHAVTTAHEYKAPERQRDARPPGALYQAGLSSQPWHSSSALMSSLGLPTLKMG